jgi:hypothetical protein
MRRDATTERSNTVRNQFSFCIYADTQQARKCTQRETILTRLHCYFLYIFSSWTYTFDAGRTSKTVKISPKILELRGDSRKVPFA